MEHSFLKVYSLVLIIWTWNFLSILGSHITMVMWVCLILLEIKSRILKVLFNVGNIRMPLQFQTDRTSERTVKKGRNSGGFSGCGPLFSARWDPPTLPSWYKNLHLMRFWQIGGLHEEVPQNTLHVHQNWHQKNLRGDVYGKQPANVD